MEKPLMRQYAGEEDYPALRNFLQEVFVANGLREYSWHVARLDYYKWHGILNCHDPGLENVRIWEADGKIVSFLNLEGPINAFPQIQPALMRTDLYGEMLAVAEAELSGIGGDGRRKIYVWADSKDDVAHGFLKHRGFVKYTEPNTASRQGRQDLHRIISEPIVPDGHIVRELAGIEELPSRSWCSWKAFHPDESDDNYEGWLWYRNIQAAPLYNRDLDMVAVAPDGEIASFCTVWYDEVTRTAYFEPVGSHPDHQRKGLGLGCITEGLRRVKKLGCRRAFIGGHSEAAKALYIKAGFSEYDLLEPWIKDID
jgi:GNAT superfamily N-acetyltransferase